ncbi:MAG: hypothetical protein ACAI25_01060 [Planctomycetota bacterium]
MRNLMVAGIATCVAAGVLSAQDAKKHELLYRWDQLDGKTAVYDTQLDALVITGRKSTTEQTDDKNAIDPADTKTEIVTATKQRLTMTFKTGDGGRGLVTVKNVRVQQTLTQKMLGETRQVSYDSDNPPANTKEQNWDKLRGFDKPYTLTVSRRGVVEKVEGRPSSELPQLKKTFLLFPDVACTESQSWNEVRRIPTPPLGDIVERFQFRLASVNEKDERRIEQRVETELDDKGSRVSQGTVVRIEKPVGRGFVAFDARGLRLEAKTEQGYELYVKQFSEGLEQRTKISETMTWKLVELK